MSGIKSQYAGKCVLCHGAYEIGDFIERAPGIDKGRAHVACVQGAARPSTSAPAEHRATNGSGVLQSMRAGLNQAIEANKEAVNALDIMREGLESALTALDHAIASRQPQTHTSRR